MKDMKKIIVSFAAAVLASGVFAAAPEFTEKDNAYVVEAKSVKGQHSELFQKL